MEGRFRLISSVIFCPEGREIAIFGVPNPDFLFLQTSDCDDGQKSGCSGGRLEGEMNQIKTMVEERISSMEGQVADLREPVQLAQGGLAQLVYRRRTPSASFAVRLNRRAPLLN
ncbi:hypothetical protein MA16_Dca005176 [Dendrobium catenatum]|uniref:Uncharacterized protein n=1 Tax=Dendrobium catenatum TaxID=906689 RepID=A0A2I0VLJ4_9ASPA|nr:hypothetical protein MA16_Dca005176 [Dendrobium catenatum]